MAEIWNLNFKQLIDTPIHRAVGIIAYLYIYRPIFDDVIINYSLFSPFYFDHFGISLIINKGTNQFIKVPIAVYEHTSNKITPNQSTHN